MAFSRNNPYLYDIDPEASAENIIKGLARQGTLRRKIGRGEGLDLDVPDMQGASAQPQQAEFNVPDIRKISPEQAEDLEKQADMQQMAENLQSEQPGLFDNISRGLSLIGQDNIPEQVRSLRGATLQQGKTPVQLTKQAPETDMSQAAQALESEQPGLFDNIKRGLSNFLTADKTPITESPAYLRAQELEKQRKAGFPEERMAEIESSPAVKRGRELEEERLKMGEAAKKARDESVPGQDLEEETIENRMGEDLVEGKSEPMLMTDAIIEAAEGQMPASIAPDMIGDSKELKDEWTKLTGLDYDEDLEEILKDYSMALTTDIEALDEHQRAIKERIDSGNLNEADYVMLGASILLPAIIAAVAKGGGADAALVALTGGISGVTTAMKEREAKLDKDWEKFSELAERKTALRSKEANFREAIKKAFPTQERNEILEGKSIKEFENPYNPDKPIIGMKIPGVGRDDLIYDIDNIGANTAKEDYKTAKENSQKAIASITMADKLNGLLDNYLDIIDQVIDKSGESNLAAIAQSKASTYFPELKHWGQVDIDWKGKKQNASIALDSIVDMAKDAYMKTQGFTRLTNNVEEHWEKLLANPFGKQHEGFDPAQARINALRMKEYVNENLVNTLNSEGFVRDPLEKKYLKSMHEDIARRDKALEEKLRKKDQSKIFAEARRQ